MRGGWDRGGETGEGETQKEKLYRAFDGESRDKKMYFSCFLCCPPSPLGNFPLLSPSLLPSSSVWHSGKIGRKPNRARHTDCSLLTLTGGGWALQILLASPVETSLTYRPEQPSIRHNSLEEAGGDGMRGKGMCPPAMLNGKSLPLTLSGIRSLIRAGHERKRMRFCRCLNPLNSGNTDKKRTGFII